MASETFRTSNVVERRSQVNKLCPDGFLSVFVIGAIFPHLIHENDFSALKKIPRYAKVRLESLKSRNICYSRLHSACFPGCFVNSIANNN